MMNDEDRRELRQVITASVTDALLNYTIGMGLFVIVCTVILNLDKWLK